MRRFETILATLALLTAAFLATAVQAQYGPAQFGSLTCYNFTNTDGRFLQNAPTMSGCNTCTRTILIYNQPNSNQPVYSVYSWGCGRMGPITQGAPGSPQSYRCIGSGMIAYQTDNSMYSASCGCCTDNCNNASFRCAANNGAMSSRVFISSSFSSALLAVLSLAFFTFR